MTNKERTDSIRAVVEPLTKAQNPEETIEIVKPLREWTTTNANVGRGEEMEGESEEAVQLRLEWYAGAVLGIVDEKAWYAMNSWLNNVDTFAPKME